MLAQPLLVAQSALPDGFTLCICSFVTLGTGVAFECLGHLLAGLLGGYEFTAATFSKCCLNLGAYLGTGLGRVYLACAWIAGSPLFLGGYAECLFMLLRKYFAVVGVQITNSAAHGRLHKLCGINT